jgi:glycosyltransferase involved in cell wall biosynthesis
MSHAFEVFCTGIPAFGWIPRVVDIADPQVGRRGHSFSLRRAMVIVRSILSSWARIPTVAVVYVTISQSKLGFFKDAMILCWAHLWRKPVVAHLHGGNFSGFYSSQGRVTKALVRVVLGPVKRVVVLAECFRSQFEMLRGSKDRIAVVYNPCETVSLPARTAPRGIFRVLFLSNLLVEKGYRDVLAAAEYLSRALPDRRFEFHFAGQFILGNDGFSSVAEMEADFRRRAAEVSAFASVEWHGSVAGELKATLFKTADVFVLPTYYVNEGQPISILEALRAALPIVTTAYRGIPELIPPAMERLLVPPKNPEAIARAIDALASDPAYYEQASAAACAHGARFDSATYLQGLASALTGASGDGTDGLSGSGEVVNVRRN